MNSSVFLAVGAGLVSTLLYIAALGFVAPMPIVIIALGWGPLYGIVSAIAGFVIISTFGIFNALSYLLTTVLPFLFIAYLIMLNRATISKTADKQSDVEWYPISNVIIWTAIISGTIATIFTLQIGLDFETYKTNLLKIFDEVLKILTQSSQEPLKIPDEVVNMYKDYMVNYLSAISSLMYFIIIAVNFWIGAKVVQGSGKLKRPWPDFSHVDFHNNIVLVLLALIVLSFFTDGMLAVITRGFLFSFLTAYTILGLIVVHVMTRNSPIRFLMLFSVYFGLIFLLPPTALLLAIIGVGEPMFQLRQKALEKHGN